MNTPSIRRTLLVRCGIGIALLFITLSISVYFVVRHGLYQEMDQSIIETASILANQMEYEHGGIIFEWEEGIGTNSEISDQVLFQYWNEKSGLTTRSPALANDNLPKFSGPDGSPDLETISVPGRIEHARAIGLVIYPYLLPEEKLVLIREGKTFEPKDFPHTLVVARDLTPVLRTLTYLAVILSIGTILTLAIGFFVIQQAVSSSLVPLEELTRQVRNRSENQLDSAIIMPGTMPSELTPLAESFDSLLSRVAVIRSRERDFIRHASHELRTPIASLSATTELALSKPRSEEEYIRHLQSCSTTTHQLSELVKRLSGLARIGQHTSSVKTEPISLQENLYTALERFSQRSASRDIQVTTSKASFETRAIADPVLLQLILNNLLDNAISYSPPSSTVSIDTKETGNRCEISVTNPSEDLPESLERLFEPLFRRDTSRSESSDSHLGIGLTLSREAAHAMQATLSARRPSGGLVRFTLSLPLAKN